MSQEESERFAKSNWRPKRAAKLERFLEKCEEVQVSEGNARKWYGDEDAVGDRDRWKLNRLDDHFWSEMQQRVDYAYFGIKTKSAPSGYDDREPDTAVHDDLLKLL
jgi:hypothetical protein